MCCSCVRTGVRTMASAFSRLVVLHYVDHRICVVNCADRRFVCGKEAEKEIKHKFSKNHPIGWFLFYQVENACVLWYNF